MSSTSPDSLLQLADTYLAESLDIHADFSHKYDLSKKAADIYQDIGDNPQFLKAQLEVSRAAFYLRDSSLYEAEFKPYLDMALLLQDTAAIAKAYNNLGIFYFTFGNQALSLKALGTVDEQNYYSAESIDENVTNLSGLISYHLNFLMNFDSAFYYINKLSQIASKYDNPSAHLTTKLKQSYLYEKSLNYKESINILRSAYQYLSEIEDQGQLYFFYSRLINNFIKTEELDSAKHYLSVMREEAKYSKGDPRNCYTILAGARLEVLMGNPNIFTEEFNICYDLETTGLTSGKNPSVVLLAAMFTKCEAYLLKEEWDNLDMILPSFIEQAVKAKNNSYALKAYEIEYESFNKRANIKRTIDALNNCKKYSDLINNNVISQSEFFIKKQMNLQFAQEQNRTLEVENQNQKLLLQQNQTFLIISLLALLLFAGIITYYWKLSKIMASQSEKLNKLVKSRTSELEKSNLELISSNEKLSESNVELERFAYIASHDLQEPIKTIIGFSNVLENKIDSEDDKVKKSLFYIKDVAQHMHQLIKDLLNYSKSANAESEIQLIDLDKMIEEIKFSLEHMTASKNARIEAEQLPEIKGSRIQILLIFKNLIENGLKYNVSEVPIVKVLVDEFEDSYRFEIRDNGVGIEKKHQDKIFEIFNRLHNRSDISGTGLGLAIVKKHLTQMGQTINLKSKPGVGTSFFFSYPKEVA